MAIILREHHEHGPPKRYTYGLVSSAVACDCYDGTEDAGWQPTGHGFASTKGEQFVIAALAWNECIEEDE